MTGNPGAWSAYVDAVLQIETPSGLVWVQSASNSRISGKFPEPEARTACVITAHNPGGRVVSDADNAEAQARLAAELATRGLTWWPAAIGTTRA